LVLEVASGLQVPPLLLKEHTVQHPAPFYKEKLMYIATGTLKKRAAVDKATESRKDLKRKELLGASL
jgi:hypothetical protein